jgi:hypothetical protein
VKVGDLVRAKWEKSFRRHGIGIIVSEPRTGVQRTVCEVLFGQTGKVATRNCNDLEIIEENK